MIIGVNLPFQHHKLEVLGSLWTDPNKDPHTTIGPLNQLQQCEEVGETRCCAIYAEQPHSKWRYYYLFVVKWCVCLNVWDCGFCLSITDVLMKACEWIPLINEGFASVQFTLISLELIPFILHIWGPQNHRGSSATSPIIEILIFPELATLPLSGYVVSDTIFRFQ